MCPLKNICSFPEVHTQSLERKKKERITLAMLFFNANAEERKICSQMKSVKHAQAATVAGNKVARQFLVLQRVMNGRSYKIFTHKT